MKARLALALLLAVLAACFLPLVAFAQSSAPPAPAYKACIWKSLWTPMGTGTEWVRGVSEVDKVKVAWWGYWCPQDDGTWGVTTQRCVVGRGCLDAGTLTGILDTAARSADPIAALQVARAQATMSVLPSEQVAWDAAEIDLLAALHKIRPPESIWKVAPNPSSTTTPPTRPMFSAADPAKQVSERATVGATCNCAKPVPKGTQTLCPLAPVNGSTPSTNLTACVKQ